MNKQKTYRVKSRSRFTFFVAIMIILLVTGFNTILGTNVVRGESVQEYISITVSQGDTLWNLAEQYMPKDMDKREAVYIISKFNKLDNASITPGQTLYIPTNHF